MNKSSKPSVYRAVSDLALETSSSDRVGQRTTTALESIQGTSHTGGSSSGCPSSKMDALLMLNVDPPLSYCALRSLPKQFDIVLRIRLIYDDDFRSNRCYVTFASISEVQSAYDMVTSLPFSGHVFNGELFRSCNIPDNDTD